MNHFTRKLVTEWRKLKLPFGDSCVVIAVSGGADSVALLLAIAELREIKKLKNRFVVAHFNHDLRGAESLADADFVRGLTTKYDFELVMQIPNEPSSLRNKKGNLEQHARNARYKFLLETAANLHAADVLTAHTLNDQAETLLINLIRGSGIEGLSGMKTKRDLQSNEESDGEMKTAKIQLVRPLLSWARREDTENFCLYNEVEFRRDAMNEDLKFSRVRIRKILLPMLADFNPKILETLARTADLLRESAERSAILENQRIEMPLKQPTENQISTLILKDLREMLPLFLRSILREWLKKNRGNTRGLQLKHIAAIENLIVSRKSGRIVELPDGDRILKKGGRLEFQAAMVEKC